jgi:hypothetical protein
MDKVDFGKWLRDLICISEALVPYIPNKSYVFIYTVLA